jgi:uncharacterized protein (DUF433 family)
MDWTGCGFVESIPGKMSGQAVVKASRVPADFLVADAHTGMNAEQIRDDYPSLTLEEIEGVLAFAQKAQTAA